MPPLVDLHCHLLAGLDDGPETLDDALDMCRMAFEQGTRAIAATAHLHERWPQSTPASIREGTKRLAAALKQIGLPLSVYPSAEVAVRPGLDAAWQRGELLGVAGRTSYILVEIPMDKYVDIQDTVTRFSCCGVCPILAHPERYPELLHKPGEIDALIALGALVQVTACSVSSPPSTHFAAAIRDWVERGVVHLVGSDGHSPDRRPPEMASAYQQIAAWLGREAAGRLCSLNGLAVLEGRPLRLPPPRAHAKSWFRVLKNLIHA